MARHAGHAVTSGGKRAVAGPAGPGRLSALLVGRPPRTAPAILTVLIVVTAVAAHLPDAAGAALGPGLFVAVLAALWLSTTAWLLVVAALGLATLPLQPRLLDAAVAAAVAASAVVVGRLVSVLAAQVHEAHWDVLQERLAHEDAMGAVLSNEEVLRSRLDHATTHDGLTGLHERSAFMVELERQLSSGAPTGVVCLALAGFAEVNELLGPDVGDQVLAALARRLQHTARDSDLVARLGGDIFAVLLADLSHEHAEPVATRLHRAFDTPFAVGPHSVPLRSRAGIACSGPNELSSDEIVRRAEVTARRARPGDPVRTWEADKAVNGVNRLALEADLHRGLLADEFYLLYQPLISTATGTISAVEALVRWRHSERGVVAPDEFIGLAERSGLIVPLGLRVLEMACAQLKAWTAAGAGSVLTVAVNVSARQLLDPDFVARVRQVIWGSGVEPGRIVLELTESLLVDDSEAAVAVLWQLRGLGVRLAIDDFGTGYSSLARLGEMPVDELKIDKSFVDRLGSNPHDSTALVTAAVAMGHGLGLEVVAEGVETAMQAAFLSSVGCDLLQGYLLGRPQPAADVTAQLGRRLLVASADIPGPRLPEGDAVTSFVPAVLPPLQQVSSAFRQVRD